MLSGGRLVASLAAGLVERHGTALAVACSACGTSAITGRIVAAATGQRRCFQNDAGGGGSDATAGSDAPGSSGSQTQSSAKQSGQQQTRQQPAGPGTPAEARNLADQLRKASPTGRLFDLFTPSDAGPSRPGRAPRASTPSTPSTPGPSPSAVPSTSTSPTPLPTDSDVVSVIMRAVDNCRPLMKVRQFKVGNRLMNVPRPLAPESSTKLAVKWILQAAAKRRDAARGSAASMADALAAELLLAYQRKGGARARREELHKLALDNRANVRAKWW